MIVIIIWLIVLSVVSGTGLYLMLTQANYTGTPAFGGTTTINPSPDKYTWYIKDYVGRNAADSGS